MKHDEFKEFIGALRFDYEETMFNGCLVCQYYKPNTAVRLLTTVADGNSLKLLCAYNDIDVWKPHEDYEKIKEYMDAVANAFDLG